MIEKDDFFSVRDFVFDGYKCFGHFKREFAVPIDTDDELIKMLSAASVAYGRYSSIDYVYKKYIKEIDISENESSKVQHIRHSLNVSKCIINSAISKRKKLNDLPDHLGLFASGVALLKLEASFSVSRFLIHKGLIFESSSIIRMILEQIAWCYEVSDIQDNDLYKVSPRKCIKKLKELIPQAGIMYGFLSERAHIEPSQIHRLVNFEKDQSYVVYSSINNIVVECYFLLVISDWFGIIMENTYREHYDDFEFIKFENNKVVINPSRESLTEINFFEKLLFEKEA